MSINGRYYPQECNINSGSLKDYGSRVVNQEEFDSDGGLRIRLAVAEDIDQVKAIADSNRHALGFVLKASLFERAQQNALLVAEIEGKIVGFVSFHHRRDGWTTIREVCVASEYRHAGVGGRPIRALEAKVRQARQQGIRLKCPIDLPANGFYSSQKFQRVAIQPGKNRLLVVWEKRLSLPSPLPKEVFSSLLRFPRTQYRP